MANTIYRGFEIRRNEDGTYAWNCEGDKWQCGYFDMQTGATTSLMSEEDAMADIDAHKRRLAALSSAK